MQNGGGGHGREREQGQGCEKPEKTRAQRNWVAPAHHVARIV